MSCKARLVLVAEQVTRWLANRTDPASGVEVARAYAPDWLDPDYWADNPNLDFDGRRVYVFPTGERQNGPMDRAHDDNQYEITVVVLRKYKPAGSEIPLDWVDGEVEWVEREVFDRLGDAREVDDPPVEDSDPVEQEWVQVYSPDLLRSLKLFRSEVRIVWRKIEDTRPT